MGKFDFNAGENDKLIRMIHQLGRTDVIAPRILAAAVPPLVRAVKFHCSKHRRTGLMEESIKQTKPKENQYGWMICVRPTGKSTKYMDEDGVIRDRKEPVRNMEIVAHMEYGTRTQKKTPVITAAVAESKKEVERLMQEEYDRIVQEMGYGR